MLKWKIYITIEIIFLIFSAVAYFYTYFNHRLLRTSIVVQILIFSGIALFFLINFFPTPTNSISSSKRKFNKFSSFFHSLLRGINSFYLTIYRDNRLFRLLLFRIATSVFAGFIVFFLIIFGDVLPHQESLFYLMPIYLCILLSIIPERIVLLMKIFAFLPPDKMTLSLGSEKLIKKIHSKYLQCSLMNEYYKDRLIIGVILLTLIAYFLALFSQPKLIKILSTLVCFLLPLIIIYPRVILELEEIVKFFGEGIAPNQFTEN